MGSHSGIISQSGGSHSVTSRTFPILLQRTSQLHMLQNRLRMVMMTTWHTQFISCGMHYFSVSSNMQLVMLMVGEFYGSSNIGH